MEDTPYCQERIEENILYLKSRGLIESDYRVRFLNDSDESSVGDYICPDHLNIMYSYASCSYLESSPMQPIINTKSEQLSSNITTTLKATNIHLQKSKNKKIKINLKNLKI